VSLSHTLLRNERVEHYIRIKTYKLIVLKVLGWEWCQYFMWLDLGLIGVCFLLWNPLYKRDRYNSKQVLLFLYKNIQFTCIIVKFLSNANYRSPILSYHHIAFKYGTSGENSANSRSLTPSRETSSAIYLHQWCPTTLSLLLPCLSFLFSNTFNPFLAKIDCNAHKPNVLSISDPFLFLLKESMNTYFNFACSMRKNIAAQ